MNVGILDLPPSSGMRRQISEGYYTHLQVRCYIQINVHQELWAQEVISGA
jgi:hypothetical protein